LKFLKHVEAKLARLAEVEALLHDPAVAADPARLRDLGKEMRELGRVREAWEEYRKAEAHLREAEHVAGESADPELKKMAEHEAIEMKERVSRLAGGLERLVIPRDPVLSKNAIVEIRAGTGGLEASLFAAQVFRMYLKYAQRHGFKVEVLSQSPTEAGGVREVIFSATGEGVFGRFKYESGVHRVQRVPVTEASGRIHTSAVTVAVLPEAEEVDVQVKPEELKIEVFRSGGPGGQSVNTTDSAVRVTHVPTGLVVKCQDEKSQIKNKAKAMKILLARLYDFYEGRRREKIARDRKAQVGTGDRSEKIRTYNFPERRVTDHRIGFTVHNLEAVLEGELDAVVEALSEREKELAA
jgi:peptide chain release factor 1